MSALPKFGYAPVSPEDYLAAERAADFKSEYYQGEVFAMAGASNEHTLVTGSMTTALNNALRDRDCTVRASDMRLLVKENGLYTYPDVSVVCGPAQFAPGKVLDTLTNPVVLVEVASVSTASYDRVGKFMLYKDLPSLRHYLLVESTKALVNLATWREHKVWAFDTFEGMEAVVPLPALGIELPLAEIYRKVPLVV